MLLWIVVELIQAGYEVVILDSLVNAREATLFGIASITSFRPDFYQIDLQDGSALDKFLFTEKGMASGE